MKWTLTMLKKTIKILCLLGIIFLPVWLSNNFYKRLLQNNKKNQEKQQQYFDILEQWLFLKQKKRSIAQSLESQGIKNIAVYGIGVLGELLYNELKDSDIKIDYITDQRASSISCEYNSVKLVPLSKISQMNQVDAILVTPCYYMEEIKQTLIAEGIAGKIISLEELIFMA